MKNIYFVFIGVLILSACSTSQYSTQPPPSVADASVEVRALAQNRWDTLIRGDVTAAYQYFSPAYRANVSLLAYQKSIRVGFWKGAVVDTVACEPEVCKVTVNITYDYREVKNVETTLHESWVKQDGKWWFIKK